MSAHPDGNHIVAGAKAGYLMGIAGLSAGPIVALDYARAKIDGYTEKGDPTLTLMSPAKRPRHSPARPASKCGANSPDFTRSST